MISFLQNNVVEILSFALVVSIILLMIVSYEHHKALQGMRKLVDLNKSIARTADSEIHNEVSKAILSNLAADAVKQHKVRLFSQCHVYRNHFNLPDKGEEGILYLTREYEVLYMWEDEQYKVYPVSNFSNGGYTHELGVCRVDGINSTYTVMTDDKKLFPYQKFHKWFLSQETPSFKFDVTNGFDVLMRSDIKSVHYRRK